MPDDPTAARPPAHGHDLVVSRARVVDPESGLDGVRDVGVTGTRVAAVSTARLSGRRVVDGSGLVLAPGFIDLHSHAQTRTGQYLQALDGVTTALELEGGAAVVTDAIDAAEAEGRLLHYGYSASWLLQRMHVLDGLPVGEAWDMLDRGLAGPRWNAPAGSADVARVLDGVAEQVDAGGIGIGVLYGYAEETGLAEYFRLAGLAASLDVPTFTHTRYISTSEPGTSLQGALELVAAAAGTGAHMHVCHLNSTSNRMIDEVAAAIARAQRYGLRVTTEAYPYGAGGTLVGAGFLAPERLHRMGITPDRLQYLPTGERIADADRLAELRATDPSGSVIVHWADERDPADRELMLGSLLFPDTAIASDAGPPERPDGRFVQDDWPVPPDARTHPRSAGCFAKTFAWLVREAGALSLPEAVRRCSLLPAQLLEDAVPAMAAKGRVQEGCDADLVLFDPDTFADQGDYTTVLPSVGVRTLVVAGTVVVDDGAVRTDLSPGRPLRSVRR